MKGRIGLYHDSKRPVRLFDAIRYIFRTANYTLVCVYAGVVELHPKRLLEHTKRIKQLGPDLIDEEFSVEHAVSRLLAAQGYLGEVLMDQRVLAGIGNVYRSELLFLTGLYNEYPMEELQEHKALDLVKRARRLLRQNTYRTERVTNFGASRPRLWVYDRAGERCMRCDSIVIRRYVGENRRVLFECLECQPRLKRRGPRLTQT